jgi:hypothetical protein
MRRVRMRGEKGKEEVRTKTVCFEEDEKKEEKDDIAELTKRLMRLNTWEEPYVTYTHLFVIAPKLVENFTAPGHFHSVLTSAASFVPPLNNAHPFRNQQYNNPPFSGPQFP